MIGTKINKLTVIERTSRRLSGSVVWKCKCDCGNITYVSTSQLNSGNTKGCGCILRKHGFAHTRPYNIWCTMKARCDNPNHNRYSNYGARGITYAIKWQTFMGFWEDMGNTYKADLTLDRIDNNKGYYKENCRWATNIEQGNNKQNSILLDFKGESRTMSQWAQKLNLNKTTIQNRLRRKWSVERAFSTPKLRFAKQYEK